MFNSINLLYSGAKGHPDEITAEWLMHLHSDLDVQDAEIYRQFLAKNTIVFRGCYGDGEHWWNKWKLANDDLREIERRFIASMQAHAALAKEENEARKMAKKKKKP
jgi:hypothetical protein